MKKLLIFLFFSYSTVQATTDCATQTDIPESECRTLLALFNSTTGAGWYDLFANHWGITETPCTWVGITCVDDHVTEINRANQGLEGSLPDLSDLTYLKVLDVSDNVLIGTIDYQQLPQSLEIFNFQGTKLTEKIEETIEGTTDKIEEPTDVVDIEVIDITPTPSTSDDEQVIIIETDETDTSSIDNESISTTTLPKPVITPNVTVSPNDTTQTDVSTDKDTQEEVQIPEMTDSNEDTTNAEVLKDENDVIVPIDSTTLHDENTPDSELLQDGHDITVPTDSTTNNDELEELPLLPLLSQGKEINIFTAKLFNADSWFRGGISVVSTDGQATSFEQNVNLINGHSVSIKGHIYVTESHVGQRADLLALGIYDVGDRTVFYTNTPENVKTIEIGEFGIPIFDDDKLLKHGVTLKESIEVVLYEGSLFTGVLNVYFGYRLESQADSIFYTPISIRAIIK